MELLSSKALQGGGIVVAWVRDYDGTGTGLDDFIDVQIYYQDHRQAESSKMSTAFQLERDVSDSDFENGDLSYYVEDTVLEFLDDIVVDFSVKTVAVDAVAEGYTQILVRRLDRSVLVVSIEVGGSLDSVVKAMLAPSLTRGRSGDCCAICLDDESRHGDDVEVAKLPCSHEFHVDCIVGWIFKCDGGSPSCPLCRSRLILGRRE